MSDSPDRRTGKASLLWYALLPTLPFSLPLPHNVENDIYLVLQIPDCGYIHRGVIGETLCGIIPLYTFLSCLMSWAKNNPIFYVAQAGENN